MDPILGWGEGAKPPPPTPTKYLISLCWVRLGFGRPAAGVQVVGWRLGGGQVEGRQLGEASSLHPQKYVIFYNRLG